VLRKLAKKIKYTYLEFCWDRFFKKQGGAELYFRNNDKDFDVNGGSLDEVYVGYPYRYFLQIENHQIKADFFGPYICVNKTISYLNRSCKGKYIIQHFPTNEKLFVLNGIHSQPVIGFKNKEDLTIFLLSFSGK
jgi:hypothetical protein